MKIPRLSCIAAAVLLSGLAASAIGQELPTAPSMTSAEKDAAKKI